MFENIRSVKIMRIHVPSDELVLDLLSSHLLFDISYLEESSSGDKEAHTSSTQYNLDVAGYCDKFSYYKDLENSNYFDFQSRKKMKIVAYAERALYRIAERDEKKFTLGIWISPVFKTDLKKKIEYHLLRKRYSPDGYPYDGYNVYMSSNMDMMPIYYGYILDTFKFLFKNEITKYYVEFM